MGSLTHCATVATEDQVLKNPDTCLQICVCLSGPVCLWSPVLCGCWTRVYGSCVCSEPGLCSHHQLPADTKFPFLGQQREWKEGRAPRPEGGGQGSSAAPLPRPQFPAKVRCPARSPRASPGAGGGGLTNSTARSGAWVPSSHLARGGPPGSPRRSWRCPRRSPGAGGGSGALSVPTAAFLPLRESPGRPLPLRHFRWVGIPPPSQAHTFREGERGAEGPGDPLPTRALHPPPPRALPAGDSRCAFQMDGALSLFAPRSALPPPPSLSPFCFFPRKQKGWKERGARPESDPGTDTQTDRIP